MGQKNQSSPDIDKTRFRDHPDVVKGFVAGVFEGFDILAKDPAPSYQAMADAFGMKPDDVAGMSGDAHLTNMAENAQFFLNSSNPTNFERTWKNAGMVYRELGRINAPVPFDNVVDFTFVKAIHESGQFKHQANMAVASFAPGVKAYGNAEKPILTQTIRINFFPNSANPFEVARDEFERPIEGRLYDPNVNATVEQVARLAGQFATATIVIEGHADSSMRGKANPEGVKALSRDRAESVKRALVERFKFNPDKFSVIGRGWDVPFDESQPTNQALNRRVEIQVIPPEQK